MGHVFLGVTGDSGAQRVCALKIIRDLSRDRDPAELAARFLDEAKVVTKLTHDNLVYVFDFGVVSGQGYLAMEFVEGKTLTEVWNRCAMRGVGFPVGLSLFAASELCSGLGYAHRAGDLRLVHRDVSPSNVMLSYTGGLKLIDFGLAKWRSKVAETQAGVNWGKVSYMSPEQYLGRPIDHRSDLFSVGLILWELLTGRQLFPSPESRSTDFEIPPPSRFNQHISPELDATVLRAVASDPAERFQSGEQMAAALLAHAPREAGKLALAEFVRSLFDTDTRSEAAERETLVAGATSLPAAPPQVAGPGHTASTGDGARDPLLGTVLTDRYFVRRLVGEGAMGRVYEGHHTGIGKRVAIKIPRHGERRKNELLQRFRLEAQAASQIRHPNIADVTDCGSTPDGRFFFVMEYIDGIDIAQLLSREGALPIERALLIAVQVCRALEAAHKAGIIHRDLKPSNVMLLRDRDQEVGDLVKVLDFGVAKFLRSEVGRPDLTRVDAAVGTPKYMAPEQIERGQDIDFRVDTYGVGGLLYFMLSGGHAPVEGDTVEDIWRRKVSDEALAISHWRSDLPPAVESLVMRSLARDPAGRPESMEILRRDLMGAIEAIRAVGSNVLPRMASSTSIINDRRVQDRRRGRKTLIALGAGGAALGLLAFTLDRARVHDPAPPQTAALRLTTSAAPAAAPAGSNVALARDPQGSSPAATIRPTPLGAAAGIAPAAAKALVAAAQTSRPAVGGQAAKAPADVKAPASLMPASPPAPATGVSPAPTDAPRLTAASGLATKRLASAGPMVSSRRRAGATPAPSPVTHVSTAEKPGVRTMPAAGGTPLQAKQLLDQAEQLFQEAQFPSAAYTARQALSAGAGAPAEVLLGKIYRNIGEFNDAKLAYQRALKLAPKDPAATEGLRKTQAALGESSRGKVAGKESDR
jgi:serine/threonine protein kinase